MCMGVNSDTLTFLIYGYFLNMGTFLLAELYGIEVGDVGRGLQEVEEELAFIMCWGTKGRSVSIASRHSTLVPRNMKGQEMKECISKSNTVKAVSYEGPIV